MTQARIDHYPSGSMVVHGGLVADDAEDAGGASGGLSRGSAVAAGGVWMGVSELPAGHASVLHHHEDQTTLVCIVRGSMWFYVTPPGGGQEEAFSAGPGQIAVIPGGLTHREENPSDEVCVCVVVRNAEQPTVVNVEGAPDAPTGDE
jgi:uncharacterized RmlC-like cupin family protein